MGTVLSAVLGRSAINKMIRSNEYEKLNEILLAVPFNGIRPFAKVDFGVDCF